MKLEGLLAKEDRIVVNNNGWSYADRADGRAARGGSGAGGGVGAAARVASHHGARARFSARRGAHEQGLPTRSRKHRTTGRTPIQAVSVVCYKICNRVTNVLQLLARNALGISAGRSRSGARSQCIAAIGGDRPAVTPPTVRVLSKSSGDDSPVNDAEVGENHAAAMELAPSKKKEDMDFDAWAAADAESETQVEVVEEEDLEPVQGELLRIRVVQSMDEPIITIDGEITLGAGDVLFLDEMTANYLVDSGVAELATL